MAGIGRKIASYVGIVDDRRYDEEDLPDEELTTEVYSDDGYEPSSEVTQLHHHDSNEQHGRGTRRFNTVAVRNLRSRASLTLTAS